MESKATRGQLEVPNTIQRPSNRAEVTIARTPRTGPATFPGHSSKEKLPEENQAGSKAAAGGAATAPGGSWGAGPFLPVPGGLWMTAEYSESRLSSVWSSENADLEWENKNYTQSGKVRHQGQQTQPRGQQLALSVSWHSDVKKRLRGHR
ncbi:hypothetical protein STEG23_021527 [Scotinomys teguina]